MLRCSGKPPRRGGPNIPGRKATFATTARWSNWWCCRTWKHQRPARPAGPVAGRTVAPTQPRRHYADESLVDNLEPRTTVGREARVNVDLFSIAQIVFGMKQRCASVSFVNLAVLFVKKQEACGLLGALVVGRAARTDFC
jgi:hypothetical protein